MSLAMGIKRKRLTDYLNTMRTHVSTVVSPCKHADEVPT